MVKRFVMALLDVVVVFVLVVVVVCGDDVESMRRSSSLAACDTVAGLEAVEVTVHHVYEESDDVPAVGGFLAYDFGEGRWLIFCFGLGFCCEHVFYCNAGRRMGSTGGWRGWG